MMLQNVVVTFDGLRVATHVLCHGARRGPQVRVAQACLRGVHQGILEDGDDLANERVLLAGAEVLLCEHYPLLASLVHVVLAEDHEVKRVVLYNINKLRGWKTL